jgi:hypothetical protein
MNNAPSHHQVQSQRRVPLPTANSTFGVGVGAPGALANSTLSTGWQVGEIHRLPFRLLTGVQVWGGATPSPQRNVSASSAPASTDPLSTQGEMPFRSNMTEGWRSSSGTWVDDSAGEFALVSLLLRGPEIAGLMSIFRGNANASTRAGQDRSASHKVSPFLPVP